jgi:hypothetical protein
MTTQHQQNENIRSQSIILQEGPGLAMVVVPTTAESSAWWSEGTKWSFGCAKNNGFAQFNQGGFAQLNQDAPIIVIVELNGTKLGFTATKTDYLCVDANNLPLELSSILTDSVLHSVLQWAATINSRIDRLMKGLSELQDFDFSDETSCREAMLDDGRMLYRVPLHFRTRELCELAVKQKGGALEDTPTEFHTKEMCEYAVQQNGRALETVPTALRTKEMCELAVQQSGYALVAVPMELLTKEMCELAVRKNGHSLQSVPMGLRTKELCKLAVESRSVAFDHVPEPFKEELKAIAEQTFQEELSPEDHKPRWNLSMLDDLKAKLDINVLNNSW